MNTVWTTSDGEFVVRNDFGVFVIVPFRSAEVAEAARGMMDKFDQVNEQLALINNALISAQIQAPEV